MIESNPELEEIYLEMMGEAPGFGGLSPKIADRRGLGSGSCVSSASARRASSSFGFSGRLSSIQQQTAKYVALRASAIPLLGLRARVLRAGRSGGALNRRALCTGPSPGDGMRISDILGRRSIWGLHSPGAGGSRPEVRGYRAAASHQGA